MLIGYARVSTDDQNRDLQRDALQRAGCGRIFEEKESGRAGTKRPALEAALAYLRPEDQLVVWKVDRLGRSLREMLETAHKLQAQGVKLRSLTEAVDTETPTGRLMFNFLGTIAEYFLDLNRERTLEGLKAAAARGRKGGRRRKLSEEDLAMARALLKDPSIPVAQIAKRLGVSRATFTRTFRGHGRGLGQSHLQTRCPSRPQGRDLEDLTGASLPKEPRSDLRVWSGWGLSTRPARGCIGLGFAVQKNWLRPPQGQTTARFPRPRVAQATSIMSAYPASWASFASRRRRMWRSLRW